MFKVIKFEVLHKNSNAHHSDNNPHRLIEFFNKEGYAFHNWKIMMQINDIHKSWTEISLLTFNLLTDNWDSVKA